MEYPLWFLLAVIVFGFGLTAYSFLMSTVLFASARVRQIVRVVAAAVLALLLVDIGPQLVDRFATCLFVNCGYDWKPNDPQP